MSWWRFSPLAPITRWRGAWATGALALVVALGLAGCGGASPSAASFGQAHSVAGGPASSSGASNTSAGTTTTVVAPTGATYLIKSLQVAMQVPHPRATAQDVERWISATDPRSTTAGLSYTQGDDGHYLVQITFLVQATLYDQVRGYLAQYAGAHGGTLLSLNETVQDVTNQYVDTQSRLSNLRAEQQRLQVLYGQATTMSDILAIEQRLSAVEGQIESTDAELSALTGQVTMYQIALTLNPLVSTAPAPSSTWKPGQTLRDAWQAALAFAQLLVDALIWVGVFCVFLVPLALVVWLVWRARLRLRRRGRIAGA